VFVEASLKRALPLPLTASLWIELISNSEFAGVVGGGLKRAGGACTARAVER
jgi:hypothetical protein